jgi:integrase/recombinase XerD
MEDQIQAFLAHLSTQRHYAANTLSAYRVDLLQLYQFVCLQRPHISSWARVDSLLLQAFLLHLKARAYSSASVARKIAAVKSFYFYLLENGQIAGNPTLSLDVPQVPKHSPRPLSEEQVQKLLGAVSETSPKGYRDRAILELMYTAGLKVTELVTLPLRAVDPQTRLLRVEGADGARLLGMSEHALDAVRLYLDKGRSALKGPDDSGPLFVNPRGRQMTRQGIWLIIKNYAKRAGIAGEITPHSLRHTFAAQRLAQGERIQDLQRLLGHAHLSTTQVYGRQRELKD